MISSPISRYIYIYIYIYIIVPSTYMMNITSIVTFMILSDIRSILAIYYIGWIHREYGLQDSI